MTRLLNLSVVLMVFCLLFQAPLSAQGSMSLDDVLHRHELKKGNIKPAKPAADVIQKIGIRINRSLTKISSWLQKKGMTTWAKRLATFIEFLNKIFGGGLTNLPTGTASVPTTSPTPTPTDTPTPPADTDGSDNPGGTETPSPEPVSDPAPESDPGEASDSSTPGTTPQNETTPNTGDASTPQPVGQGFRFKAWGWVNTKPGMSILINCDKDLLVLDQDEYDENEITQIKAGGKRTVISYLSVGEVEKYRSHYEAAKDLVCRNGENEDWPDNFKVQYWNPRWLEILKPVVDEINGKGFQGFYFDVVDAWEANYGTKAQMTEFLIKLCTYIRSKNPEALIFFQNSHRLFDDARLSNLMSGMSQEGLYCSWNPEYTIKGSERDEKVQYFKRLLAQGKWIGVLEYTRDPTKMTKIKPEAVANGFLPYFADKELKKLWPKY